MSCRLYAVEVDKSCDLNENLGCGIAVFQGLSNIVLNCKHFKHVCVWYIRYYKCLDSTKYELVKLCLLESYGSVDTMYSTFHPLLQALFLAPFLLVGP